MENFINESKCDKFKQLDDVIASYQGKEGVLIQVLKKAQDIFGFLPERVQSYVSMKLDIPISTINGVVSFYSLFTQEQQGKYAVGVCLGTACYVKGAQEVLNAIKEELHIDVGETTVDHQFTLKATRCVGACSLAPVVMINEDVHGRLTPADIPSLIHQYAKKNDQEDLHDEE